MSAKKKETLEDLREKYNLFVFELDDVLDAHKAFIKSLNRPDLLPLDYSIESLDRAEQSLIDLLDGKIQLGPDQDQDVFVNRLARYLGEVVRRQVQGYWDFEKNPANAYYGLPAIGNIKGMPDGYLWTPFPEVQNYKKGEGLGRFKQAAQYVVDIYQARQRSFEQVANIEKELNTYRQHIASYNREDLLPLDFSVESLDKAEKTLELGSKETTPDAISDWLALYLGEVLRRQIGGEWVVNTNPDQGCIGLPGLAKLEGFAPDFVWCPSGVLDYYKRQPKKGGLRKVIESVIAKSKKNKGAK